MSLPFAVDERGNALVRLVRCDNAELEEASLDDAIASWAMGT